MAGVARECPVFADGIDCLEALSLETAQAFRADGYQYVGRYLETLTSAERDDIWAAGLGIWLLTLGSTAALSSSFGDARAASTTSRGLSLGVVPRVHVTIDQEAASENSEADNYAYCDHFSAGICRSGWQAALYAGAGIGMTAVEEFRLPNVNCYIRGGSVGIPEPACGFVMIQFSPLDVTIHGQRVDVSKVGRDARGRGITMWWGE